MKLCCHFADFSLLYVKAKVPYNSILAYFYLHYDDLDQTAGRDSWKVQNLIMPTC